MFSFLPRAILKERLCARSLAFYFNPTSPVFVTLCFFSIYLFIFPFASLSFHFQAVTHLSEGGVGKDGVGPAGAHPTGGLLSLCLPLFAITTSISIFLQADRYEGTLRAIKIPQVFTLATCLTVLRERTICFKMGDSAICSPMAVEIPIEQLAASSWLDSSESTCSIICHSCLPHLILFGLFALCGLSPQVRAMRISTYCSNKLKASIRGYFSNPGAGNTGKLRLTRYHLKVKEFISCCWVFIEPNMSLKHNNITISPPQSIIFNRRPPIG